MLVFILSLFHVFFYPEFNKPGLTVSLSNIKQAKGKVYVAVYDKQSVFLSMDKMIDRKIITVTNSGNVVASFENLPPGQYAISCFHDHNGNGKLDTNFLGVPTEPYGFSNNARPKFRAPSWDETKFYLNTSGYSLNINLEKW